VVVVVPLPQAGIVEEQHMDGGVAERAPRRLALFDRVEGVVCET